ncbi:MAG: aminodeoxychorismate/anthranilate synthase component II [Deltaproteobacteria bacterium]|nr:aminodeoxychorismate/anthranilate synthase component II [Deltaproteobacteria bacterium]MBW2141096.1 aminodeoxychorismate/anthranilate synthase component II [Deltaproteobacteria bacterium]
MFVMIDNYDSFTYNLVHLLSDQGAQIRVFRNDQVTLEEIKAFNPQGLILSPGPGRPEQAGISLEVVRQLAPSLPILGVCLGHQTIAAAFGARIMRAQTLYHGKGSRIQHNAQGIFAGVKTPFLGMRYHSLLVDRESLPDCFEIIAQTENAEIMGLRHRVFPVSGVQFHPESVMAEEGARIVQNFLKGVNHDYPSYH